MASVDKSDILRSLKKMGVLNETYKGKSWKRLTPQQKSNVSRLHNKFKAVIASPAQYLIKPVSSTEAKKLRRAGYHVVGGKAIIKSDPGAKITVQKTKTKSDPILRIKNKYEDKSILGWSILDLVEYEIENEQAPPELYKLESKFDPKTVWAISVGGKPLGNFFDSIDTLIDYFNSYLSSKLPEGLWPRAHLMIVHNRTLGENFDLRLKTHGQDIKDKSTRMKKAGTFRKGRGPK